MKTMKKVLSVLLLVCLLAGVMPAAAYAAGASLKIVATDDTPFASRPIEIYKGDAYTFHLALDDTESVGYDATNTAWYVNGVKKAEGAEFTYRDASASSFAVMAQLVYAGYPTLSDSLTVNQVAKPVPCTGISISGGPNSIKTTEQAKLTATLYPANTTDKLSDVEWTVVENTDVVSVDKTADFGASVVPLKAGTAKIRASFGDDIKAYYDITVTQDSSTVNISLNATKKDFPNDDNDGSVITAFVSPSDVKITDWAANPATAVTITADPDDSNKITVSPASGYKGWVTITAYSGSASKSIDLNIKDPSATSTVTVSPKVAELPAKSSMTLTATVINNTAGAADSFNHWYTDSSAVTLTNTKSSVVTVTGVTPSADPVRIYAYSSSGAYGYADITVTAARELVLVSTPERVSSGNKALVTPETKLAGETFTWNYETYPAGLDVASKVKSSGEYLEITAGKDDGYVYVTAKSNKDGSVAYCTVYINSVNDGNAEITPTNVTWTKGQGNLEFTVKPFFYSAYVDNKLISGSANSDKYSYVWSGNLVLKSAYLATLKPGAHILKVVTCDENNVPSGTVFATINIVGTTSAVYGDNAHVRGTTSDLIFNSTGAITAVTIGNTSIDPANYTLSNNGKTITLKSNFLNLLNYGTYTMKLTTQATNANGTAGSATETTSFRIVTANYAPATGDESNLAIWLAVMMISGVGVLALIPRKKKEM